MQNLKIITSLFLNIVYNGLIKIKNFVTILFIMAFKELAKSFSLYKRSLIDTTHMEQIAFLNRDLPKSKVGIGCTLINLLVISLFTYVKKNGHPFTNANYDCLKHVTLI